MRYFLTAPGMAIFKPIMSNIRGNMAFWMTFNYNEET